MEWFMVVIFSDTFSTHYGWKHAITTAPPTQINITFRAFSGRQSFPFEKGEHKVVNAVYELLQKIGLLFEVVNNSNSSFL